MRRIEIQIESRRALHDLFENELPAPYGRTLDALHDQLCATQEEIEIVFDKEPLYEALGDRYCENFLRMLSNTALENPKLRIVEK